MCIHFRLLENSLEFIKKLISENILILKKKLFLVMYFFTHRNMD